MRLVCIATAAALLTGGGICGVIQGVVLEHASGRALARTMVTLRPVPQPGVANRSLQIRAGITGQFVFHGVPEGLYLLTAARDTFFPAFYGQRRPEGYGAPISVTRDSDLFAELRMRRKGAISGRVLDENGVGMAGVPVLAYRARLPLRQAGRGVSDDRGVYRIHSLPSGRYWVRTAAHTLEDGSGRLPTFGPESRETRDARVQIARVDGEAMDADLRPEPGRLFRLSGRVFCSAPEREGTPIAVNLTVSSESGRRIARVVCMGLYSLEGLAPGTYEVYAETTDGAQAGFTELSLGGNSDSGHVQIRPIPRVEFDIRRGNAPAAPGAPLELLGRRLDLSETGGLREIPLPRAFLQPGHWEMTARAGPGQFVESIGGFYNRPRRPWRPERDPDWHEVFIETSISTTLRIVISEQSGGIAGSVINEGKPVPGVPVFLLPIQEAARRSLHGPTMALSDVQGRYRFDGLPPADYRVLATYDISEAEPETFDEARAPTIRVEPVKSSSLDLTLWLAP